MFKFIWQTFSDDDEGRKLLQKLSDINRPLKISFKEMIQLMSQCQFIDTQRKPARTEVDGTTQGEGKTGAEPSTVANTLPILKGIIPGGNFDYSLSFFFIVIKCWEIFRQEPNGAARETLPTPTPIWAPKRSWIGVVGRTICVRSKCEPTRSATICRTTRCTQSKSLKYFSKIPYLKYFLKRKY